MPTKYPQFSRLNSYLSLDRLKINERIYISSLIQNFEDDFLWKVILKDLNSGIILKTFTHVRIKYKIISDIVTYFA